MQERADSIGAGSSSGGLRKAIAALAFVTSVTSATGCTSSKGDCSVRYCTWPGRLEGAGLPPIRAMFRMNPTEAAYVDVQGGACTESGGDTFGSVSGQLYFTKGNLAADASGALHVTFDIATLSAGDTGPLLTFTGLGPQFDRTVVRAMNLTITADGDLDAALTVAPFGTDAATDAGTVVELSGPLSVSCLEGSTGRELQLSDGGAAQLTCSSRGDPPPVDCDDTP